MITARRKSGFTMLEIMIVLVVVAILSSIAVTFYSRSIERSRIAEARMVLGEIRDAQVAYYLIHQTYADMFDLAYEPPTACDSTHYFKYAVTSATNIGTAFRCIAGEGGKQPDGPLAYTVTINYDTGEWGGDTAGYY
jgi:prepilin-type N-terminal cleavage/methylation domain-containing protein